MTCTHAGPLAASNSLPDITLTVNVAAAAAPSVTNTASVSGTLFDNVSSNDSDSDSTNVLIPDLSTSVKSVVDLNGGDADPGDTLRYTITVNETGGVAASGVSVTDTIDALLTGFSVVSIPAGATDSSTPGTGPLNVTGINVPASGSVTVVFDTTIVGTANPGDAINNTAVVVNPADSSNNNAAAPAVIVSASSLPSSGIKNLYTYFDTNSLSRLVPASDTDSGIVNDNGGSVVLQMSPATQSALS